LLFFVQNPWMMLSLGESEEMIDSATASAD